jgi:hypothetical protein
MVCYSRAVQQLRKIINRQGRALSQASQTMTNQLQNSSYMLRGGGSDELSRDRLMSVAPSAYADAAFAGTSDRYAFFPTDTVIEALRETGWVPVIAQEQRARQEARFGFQKHMVRFHRREELGRAVLHDSRLELVLMNSHDGGCAFRIFAGVFRLVCSNGLVVSDASYGAISIRHTRKTVDQVITASQGIAGHSDRIGESIAAFRQRQLSDAERNDFAARALTLRYDSLEAAPVRPSFLLEAKRREDAGASLWQAFNTVQENMMRGSRPDRAKARIESRRVARVRGLTGLDAQLTLNRDLWKLAASYLN